MLDREPAAVLIGGTLLGVLTLALIVAMFIHTPVPEVLTSMVLLILGFFFGQTSNGRGGRGTSTTKVTLSELPQIAAHYA